MRDAFADYLEHNKSIEAIFVGTRRTDPHGGQLGSFQRTDGGWPDFMRMHPVIGWRYGEVWAFLKHLNVPYCELYDQGYTSLGGTMDTHPNPALEVVGPAGELKFRPAYELEDDDLERAGRGDIKHGAGVKKTL
ncbi:3'-phosphoadenosine 5'-phosphosulfate sulfotransferase [Pseudocyphellaria aurata]|nr:3'-phosphoadenosine 5'-phosphosulfate sulfotransferase [Pseudocyphellaria aurata]